MNEERPPAVMKSEELDAAVEQLLSEARDLGRALERVPGRVRRQSPEKPDIRDLQRARLRRALEEEITPAFPASQGVIDPRELQREVIKKALISIHLPKLRQVARELRLTPTGSAEHVAERVARAFDWDEAQIVRLVLDNEEEPSIERSHIDRLFPVAEYDFDQVRRRLEYVVDRYVRIGVARWFVFDSMSDDRDGLLLTGSLRAYRASVDDVDGTPVLTPIPSEENLRIFIPRGDRVMRIAEVGPTAGRAAMTALAVSTGASALRFLPTVPAAGVAKNWGVDDASLFMLDLIHNRLRHAGFGSMNLTVARFKVSDDREVERANRPTLRAVRFEGSHLLDSIPACRLLAREGRAMTEIALTIATAPSPSSPPRRYPIRISLEVDHVVVTTGFGADEPERSRDVHRSALSAVSQELRLGHEDDRRLENLVARMAERGLSETEPEQADMLTDPEAAEDDFLG